uniref:Lysosomal acid phosphatase n=1 Tax=Panagrolaimus sp. ES5 TaxID=591445 RepID=A0AC34G7R5_9BILA
MLIFAAPQKEMFRFLFSLFVLILPIYGEKLLLVQTLFRHGDRTPSYTYPNDPYQESHWGESWGQLTTRGMTQHFEQGIKIRDRYIYDHPFISGEYRDYDAYSNRTLMSAYSHIAGFYEKSDNTYPHGNAKWPTRWTPVPVHTVEFKTDHLLNTEAHCPRREEIHKTLKSNSKFKTFMSQHEPLLRTISQKSGINTDDFETFAHVERFYS